MKIVKLFLYAVAGLLAAGCSGDDADVVPPPASKELKLNYTLPASVQTYAGVEALASENQIYDLYTLFFDPSAGNEYIGCQRSSVGARTQSGTSRVAMPAGYDVMDAWELLFIANLETYLPSGVTDAGDWLWQQLANRDIDYAIENLMGESFTALRSPLPMSGKQSKPAATNEVDANLVRRVARVDVTNAEDNFVLENAQVWNARSWAYLLNNGVVPADHSGNSHVHYTDNIVSQTAGAIKGGLYAFPNISMPLEGDIHTTCLIIGGKYTGPGGSGNVTYYRVNVCASNASQQMLNGNSIYTINISRVTGDGASTPDEAHNKDNLLIDYTINEWDDTYNTLYVFDSYGNGLGVSQRFVNFSYRGPQEADIEVFRKYSDTNPLTGTWTVASPTGTHSTAFTAVKQDDTSLTVGVVDDNTLVADREAQAVLTWGTIELPVVLTQLSTSSQLEGVQATPSTISFPLLAPNPREVCVNLRGNYTGITRADIETAIVYTDSGNTGWLQLLPGSTSDDPDMGLFYFNVLPSEYVTVGIREAEIKFVVRKGDRLSTTQVYVFQTPDSGTDGEMRLVEIRCYEYDEGTDDYINRGATTGINKQITGLPVGQNRANDIHFRMIKHEYVKYKLFICSSQDWEIIVSGVAAQALDFSQTSGVGDYTTTVEVEVTVKNDTEYGWDGVFYIQYADGESTPVVVHQTGIIDSSMGDGVMYYYGLMNINGKLWLDRNIGASAPMDADDPKVGYYQHVLPEFNKDARAQGTAFSASAKNTACPSGFRIPFYSTDGSVGEWEYVFQNVQYNYTESEEHPALTYWLPYGDISNPRLWYVPITSNYSGTYWATNTAKTTNYVITFSITTANRAVTWSSNVVNGSNFVRCVYDDTL